MRKGFTLAEVLITLGIIGVVAALTISTLIGKYKEKETVSRLKKVYSTLSQAYNSSVADFGSNPKDWGMISNNEPQSHIIMANHFVPYLKLIENCVGQTKDYTEKHCQKTGWTAEPNAHASVVLNDGTVVTFRNWWKNCSLNYGATKELKSVCGAIIVDLNGRKLPNNYGIDQFLFYLTNYGVYPTGMNSDIKLAFNKKCDSNTPWGSQIDGFTNGIACTAWIIYNENMDYLHCSDLSWNGKHKCADK